MTTTLKKIESKNDSPSLSDAQKFVGGWVELVKVKDGILLIDEEGKLKDKPVNADAMFAGLLVPSMTPFPPSPLSSNPLPLANSNTPSLISTLQR